MVNDHNSDTNVGPTHDGPNLVMWIQSRHCLLSTVTVFIN